ncbi:MAG: P-loop NTPase [Solirubrobacteraceae bacterium]|nr:P-loop NTPase [Solirubrobacteraceae bacterium]
MPGDLLDRRLVVVTGKGGVGKSTVAAALAIAAARRGRRVVVAEVGRRGDVAATLAPGTGARFGEASDTAEHRFDERRLTVGDLAVGHVSVSPEAALHEYLRDQLPIGPLAGLLSSSRFFTALTAATPGMREVLAMGKLWELGQPRRRTPGAEPYDLCVVDAPASGHATAMLGAPGQFARTARVGPVARQGATIAATIEDPEQTAVVVVATAEELPVTEAGELRHALDERGLPVALGVVNGLLDDRFDDADRARLTATTVEHPAIAAARHHAARAAEQRRQLDRFRRAVDAPVATLPLVPVRRLDATAIGDLADRLDPSWAPDDEAAS